MKTQINKTRNKRNKTKKNTQYLPMNHINKIVYKASKKDYVLLGESTHGTREFYNTRLNITKRLINNYKFNTVFLETEWSLGYKLNKYIHSKLKINAETLLEETFVKFPKWMTCNKYIVKLLDFMKNYNTKNTRKVYLYGIDCQDVELAKVNVCSEPDLNCPIVTEIIKNYEIMKQSNYWNARDSFWLKIIKRVAKYRKSKFILWAHNSHIGDVTANIRQQYKRGVEKEKQC
jgi:erythromycin esterase-like protein